mgnify:CR=1 FL=1
MDYQFFGGVYNTQRGYNGFHSVAYVRDDEDGNFVRCYNDSFVEKVFWEDMNGFAKLLFYCKV